MATTLPADLLDRPALTTTDVVVERRRQTVTLVDLMLMGNDGWRALDDADRRQAARRLLYARWRLNRADQLRHRATPARRSALRHTVVSEVATAALMVVCCVYAAWVAIARRVGGRR